MDPDRQPERAADALHEVVLPVLLPLLPRLDLAGSCLVTDAEPAGAWADTTVLADGRVGLQVGDACGRGPHAVATALRLRTIACERLRAGDDLPSVLAAVHAFADQLPSARVATVCVAMLEPESGVLEYVTAGHPPPTLVLPDGRWQDLPPVGSGALAMPASEGVGRAVIAPGALVLLRTTGSLDRSVASAAEASDLGRAAAAAFFNAGGGHGIRRTVETVCDRVLERLASDATTVDDVLVVAAERMPAPYAVDVSLPADPASLATLRSTLWEWLRDLRARDEDVVTLIHAVGEVAANAVEHAYADLPQPGSVELTAVLEGSGEAVVTVRDRGRWRGPRPARDVRGRGLALTRGLVDAVLIESGAEGTVVTVRHCLGRPVRIVRATAADRPPRSEFRTTDNGPSGVCVHGPVDHRTADTLRGELLLRSRGGTLPLVVDLSEVTVLAGAGVQVLVESLGWHQPEADLSLVASRGCVARAVLERLRVPYGDA